MQVIDVTSGNFAKAVSTAVRALQRGVLVCPTDTVYGLVADATNKKAVQKIFQIKGRKQNKPIPIFVKDLSMAKQLGHIDKDQEQFLKKVWPGKVTALLTSRHTLPKEVEVTDIIGLRIPDHPFIAAILEKLNRPLTGTSANIAGYPACSSSADVTKQFQRRKYQPDLLIDAGSLPKAKPSTVIDITGEERKTIRE